MIELVFNDLRIDFSNINITYMNVTKNNPKSFIMLIEVKNTDYIMKKLNNAKREVNTFEMVNNGNTVIKNDTVVNVLQELRYEAIRGTFEEQIIFEAEQPFI